MPFFTHITSLHRLSRVILRSANFQMCERVQANHNGSCAADSEGKENLLGLLKSGSGFQQEHRIARERGAAGKEGTQGFQCDEWILRCQQRLVPLKDSPVNLCLLSPICANQTPRLGSFKWKNEKLKANVGKAWLCVKLLHWYWLEALHSSGWL